MLVSRINEFNEQLDLHKVELGVNMPGSIESDIYQHRVIILAALNIARIFTLNPERRAKIKVLIYLCSL